VSAGGSPADRIGAEIDALFAGDRDLVEVLEDVARLGARLIIQTAVEAEVTEFSAGPATSALPPQDARPGARNGSWPTTIKTTAGPVTIDRPKLRGTTERFASRRFGVG
jgi:putative transposase